MLRAGFSSFALISLVACSSSSMVDGGGGSPIDPNKSGIPTNPGDPILPGKVGEQSYALELDHVESCSAVSEHLRARTRVWMNETIDSLIAAARAGEDESCWGASAGEDDAGPGGGPSSVSETNNQVADVDEADLVKTDGHYLYLAQGKELRIVAAWPASDAQLASRITLPGLAKKLFISGDRALVYVSVPRGPLAEGSEQYFPAQAHDCTYGYDCDFTGDGYATEIHIFDISDKTAPEPLRTLTFPGSLIAARRIGSTVHSVVSLAEANPAGLEFPENGLCDDSASGIAKYIAELEAARDRNEKRIQDASFDMGVLAREGERALGAANCSDFYRETAGDGQGITSLVSLDLESDADPTLSNILSRGGAVYASAQSLYLAVAHQRTTDSWYDDAPADEVTTVHRFRIGTDPADSGYIASGMIPGHVLNQFSMDEHDGYLRVATSKGRVPSPDVESVVSVLGTQGHALNVVGQVDHIAPKEDIRSVRFDGARGYLVTFKKTDPLFVLDLANPEAPAVVGELKIPGFSTYMHLLDDRHLLALGYEADDMGDFAYFNGIQLQLFDVTDPTDPQLLHKQVYGTRGSSSSALTDHLGFTFMADRNLLTLPMSICDGGGNGMYGKLSFSGVVALDVTLKDGFQELGRLEEPYPAQQSAFQYGNACQDWWTDSNSVVSRTVVMDQYVYAVSDKRVRVQSLDALGTDVAVVDF